MKNLLQKILLITVTFMMGFSLINTVLADSPQKATPPPIVPLNQDILKIPHKSENIQENDFLQKGLIPGITATVVSITGGLSLLFSIIGGLQMLLSFGDPEKFGKGRKIITWALVGLVISMLSYAIVAIIASIKV